MDFAGLEPAVPCLKSSALGPVIRVDSNQKSDRMLDKSGQVVEVEDVKRPWSNPMWETWSGILATDLLVPNQWIKSHKSLSWRHLLVFGLF